MPGKITLKTRQLAAAVSLAVALSVTGGCALGSARPKLGIWVPAEGDSRPLQSDEKLDTLLDRARAAGAKDLFVQVFRGGRAWWASDIFEHAIPGARDPLGELLARAGAAGIRVHAWVNVYNLGTKPSARAMAMLPDTAITRDNEGRNIVTYLGEGKDALEAELDTPGVWLDPSSPEANDFVLKAVRELATRYPSLAGVHLDFVRYPYAIPTKPAPNLARGIEFGFGETAIERFKAEKEKDVPFKGTTGDVARDFAVWRREQVNGLVKKTRDTLPEKMQLSAAVVAWADRAYLSSFQDWRRWLEDGTVNFVVSMSYSRDERFYRYLVKSAVAARPERSRGSPRVWVGLGAWDIGADRAALHRELDTAGKADPDGVVIFSYDDIDKEPLITETMRKWQQGEAPPIPPGAGSSEPNNLWEWMLQIIQDDQDSLRKTPPPQPVPAPVPPTAPSAPVTRLGGPAAGLSGS